MAIHHAAPAEVINVRPLGTKLRDSKTEVLVKTETLDFFPRHLETLLSLKVALLGDDRLGRQMVRAHVGVTPQHPDRTAARAAIVQFLIVCSGQDLAIGGCRS
jgi:hypothetical protein